MREDTQLIIARFLVIFILIFSGFYFYIGIGALIYITYQLASTILGFVAGLLLVLALMVTFHLVELLFDIYDLFSELIKEARKDRPPKEKPPIKNEDTIRNSKNRKRPYPITE
jgi:hypothetical protein